MPSDQFPQASRFRLWRRLHLKFQRKVEVQAKVEGSFDPGYPRTSALTSTLTFHSQERHQCSRLSHCFQLPHQVNHLARSCAVQLSLREAPELFLHLAI